MPSGPCRYRACYCPGYSATVTPPASSPPTLAAASQARAAVLRLWAWGGPAAAAASVALEEAGIKAAAEACRATSQA
jgi:hypothetical protein